MKYYVYIVVCRDNTFYTGYTRNIRKRLNQHNGISFLPGARYTKTRRPIFLQHIERFPTRSDAMRREKEIKEMSHDEKLELINRTTKEQIISAI